MYLNLLKKIDKESLISGKSISIKLVKKVLKMNIYKTHNCSELNLKNKLEKVKLSGWLHKKEITVI